MKKGSMRWVVGLLAGGAFAVAGCQGGEGDAGDREGRAFETPQHREDRPKPKDEAETRGASNDHPASMDQESPGGQLSQGTPMGGGTAAPNNAQRPEAAGVLPSRVSEGLGTSLADAYQAPVGQGGTATGGSGAAGAAPQGGATSGSATQGDTSGGGGAGTAAGGGASGQAGPK